MMTHAYREGLRIHVSQYLKAFRLSKQAENSGILGKMFSTAHGNVSINSSPTKSCFDSIIFLIWKNISAGNFLTPVKKNGFNKKIKK